MPVLRRNRNDRSGSIVCITAPQHCCLLQPQLAEFDSRGQALPSRVDIVAKVQNCPGIIFPPQDNPTRDRRST
jgi:hypothetical protein